MINNDWFTASTLAAETEPHHQTARYPLHAAQRGTRLVRQLAGAAAAFSIMIAGTAFGLSNVESATQPQIQAAQDTNAELMTELRVAAARLRAGDMKGAETGLNAISQAPNLAGAPAQLRYAVYVLLATCEQTGGEPEAAYANLIRAGETMPAARHRDYWRSLVVAANAVHEDYVAVEALSNAITDDAAHANDIVVGTIVACAHRDDAAGPLRAALQCADDQDGLAAIIIERLDDPLTRNTELAFVQAYLPEPHPTPYDNVMLDRLHAVLARPDVHAAIARYGVVESYPVFPPDD
jgi:hypothetical protein